MCYYIQWNADMQSRHGTNFLWTFDNLILFELQAPVYVKPGAGVTTLLAFFDEYPLFFDIEILQPIPVILTGIYVAVYRLYRYISKAIGNLISTDRGTSKLRGWPIITVLMGMSIIVGDVTQSTAW